ncbi:hypothetical protein [Streptomyces sp. CT34]|uniref:hypothetical protein n=1 Tax=Streptomyces sp. CT34 TaxID=1553907 RepID=UPI0005B9762B|nr:hypothetical protein [Streptomyces sp. CT34]
MTEQQVVEQPEEFVAATAPELQPPWFSRWSAVPWTLASKSQMARADLPREPAGPVRGYVAGRDYRNKETEIPLYDVRESRPTRASGVQLASAEARRTATVRVCTDCGAQCQLPLSERQGRYLCAMCWRIATVVDTQIELRERRAENAAWARGLFASGPLAVTWVELVAAEPTPSGRRRPPLAGRVHVVDENGKRVLDVLVRLAGPRTKGAPEDAVTPEVGAAKLARAFAGRRRVVWGPLGTVLERLGDLRHPVELEPAAAREQGVWHQYRRNWPDGVAARYAQWRGELDPATGELRTPWQPGTADRLWLCLKRMAETQDAGRPGESQGSRREAQERPYGSPVDAYEVRVAVTGPDGAGERLAELLAAQEAVLPASLVGPVPSREVPGAVVTYMAGRGDVLVPAPANGTARED